MTIVTNIQMIENPQVIRTWRNNQSSSTIVLSLPHQLAKKHGIGVHTNLLAIDTDRGILLRKLNLEGME